MFVVTQDEEDAAMRLAMALSMQSESQSASAASVPASAASGAASSSSDMFIDPAFVSQLLGSVDVDSDDPLIRAALAQINANAGGTEDPSKSNKKRKEGPEDDEGKDKK